MTKESRETATTREEGYQPQTRGEGRSEQTQEDEGTTKVEANRHKHTQNTQTHNQHTTDTHPHTHPHTQTHAHTQTTDKMFRAHPFGAHDIRDIHNDEITKITNKSRNKIILCFVSFSSCFSSFSAFVKFEVSPKHLNITISLKKNKYLTVSGLARTPMFDLGRSSFLSKAHRHGGGRGRRGRRVKRGGRR